MQLDPDGSQRCGKFHKSSQAARITAQNHRKNWHFQQTFAGSA
jgi:hypothetical protein